MVNPHARAVYHAHIAFISIGNRIYIRSHTPPWSSAGTDCSMMYSDRNAPAGRATANPSATPRISRSGPSDHKPVPPHAACLATKAQSLITQTRTDHNGSSQCSLQKPLNHNFVERGILFMSTRPSFARFERRSIIVAN